MIKVCIFCNKQVNSNEHVWPRWLLNIIKQWPGYMGFEAMQRNQGGENGNALTQKLKYAMYAGHATVDG